MSHPEPAPAAPLPSWQQARFLKAAVPGWGLSLVTHTLFLFMLSSSLQSCGNSGEGEFAGDFRQVGIVMAEEPSTTDSRSNAQSTVPAEPQANPADVPEIPTEPPTEINVPGLNPEIAGPGSISPPAALIDPSTTILDSAPNSVPIASRFGAGDGAVGFFDSQDTGESFVYLIDCSGSMGDFDALDYAKAELLASLQSLTAKQKFQVAFYNDRVNGFSIPGAKGNLYPATDLNKNKAKRFILGVEASLGTRHLPALEWGLAVKPDAIFFLTDANSALSAADLAYIKRSNTNKTRIHCVEFGTGKRINAPNFATRLADQNDGGHSYRDVTRLAPKTASVPE